MPKNYFRVDGADKKTGEETYLVLQAQSKPQAEKLARQQGLLISSVRVAKATDWEAAPAAPPPEEPAAAMDAPAEDPAVEAVPRPVRDPAPAIAEAQPFVPAPSPTAIAARRGPAPIILCGVGAALVLGGALALTLALWPDNSVRNELQQVDFRLHEVSQTVLGSMLVLAGMIVLLLAAILFGRTKDAAH